MLYCAVQVRLFSWETNSATPVVSAEQIIYQRRQVEVHAGGAFGYRLEEIGKYRASLHVGHEIGQPEID